MSSVVEFARDELKLPLWPGQADVLTQFENGGYRELVLQAGRRSGKSTMSDCLAVYDAVVRDHLFTRIRPGEPKVTAIISPKQAQSERHIARCGQLVRNSKHLSQLLIRETSDSLHFSNGSVIAVYSASARGLRGDSWSAVILDEFGWFLDGDGNQAGQEILDAARPALSTFGSAGWLIALSTPGAFRRGAFYDLSQVAASGKFKDTLFIQRSSAAMNPTIPAAEYERREAEDVENYRREFLAEWVDADANYLRTADVVAAVRKGRKILPPMGSTHYEAAIDPAFSGDNFTLCIGHREDKEQIVIDGVWAWHRMPYEQQLDEIVALLDKYRCREVSTDQHAAEPIRAGLAQRQVTARYEPWTTESKLSAFTALKTNLSSGTIELPDDDALVRELCALTIKPTPAGYARISAAKDDRSVVVASVCERLRPKMDEGFVLISADGFLRDEEWESDEARQGGIFGNRGWFSVD